MYAVVGAALKRRTPPPNFAWASFSSAVRGCLGSAQQQQKEKGIEKGSPTLPSDMGDAGDELKGYTIIREGEAEILMHSSNSVFYNKAQINNRDMSIAVLRTFISRRKDEHAAFLSKKLKVEAKASEEKSSTPVKEKITPAQEETSNGESDMPLIQSMDEPDVSDELYINTAGGQSRELKPPRVLEALAASGLRALRYAREVEGIGQVMALDNDQVSIEACKKNIQFNGSLACSKVEAHLADARVYMLTHQREFDVVDLDPYGSPSVFLDSAVQSVADGGMLMCTATDMAVLCGGNGEVCYVKYGSYPLKAKYCHEMALRILLACIESHANRYKRYIVPILSVQMDFYIRVFVRIYTSASTIKSTPLKLSYVYQCVGCDSFHLQPLGRTVTKELPDVPLFVSLHNLCATLKCTSPSAVMFRSAVINAGYRVSGSHVNPLGLKSDAPMDVIWDIMRCWVKTHPVKAHPADQSGTVILSKEPRLQANFARAVASLSKAQAKKVARFLPNPERHWGPKVRAGRQITSKHASLLGLEKINGFVGHDEGKQASPLNREPESSSGHEEEESDHKRQRIGEESMVTP